MINIWKEHIIFKKCFKLRPELDNSIFISFCDWTHQICSHHRTQGRPPRMISPGQLRVHRPSRSRHHWRRISPVLCKHKHSPLSARRCLSASDTRGSCHKFRSIRGDVYPGTAHEARRECCSGAPVRDHRQCSNHSSLSPLPWGKASPASTLTHCIFHKRPEGFPLWQMASTSVQVGFRWNLREAKQAEGSMVPAWPDFLRCASCSEFCGQPQRSCALLPPMGHGQTQRASGDWCNGRVSIDRTHPSVRGSLWVPSFLLMPRVCVCGTEWGRCLLYDGTQAADINYGAYAYLRRIRW